MRAFLTVIAVTGVLAAAQPAWSQAPQQSGHQIAPGGGGTSGTGVRGKPGNKSGPAAKPSNGMGMGTGTAPAGADTSGIKGMPGNKSGPATKEPGQNR